MSFPPSPPQCDQKDEHRLDLLLRSYAAALEAARVDSPRLSAELLLAHALGLERDELLKLLILDPGKALPPQTVTRATCYVGRRARGEPAAYIIGRKEFYGRAFRVSPATLIPRPETELLIDFALEHARSRQPGGVFADFGAGSGCLAISLAHELDGWRGIALEMSPPALEIARQNARELKAGNLYWIRADFARSPLRDSSLDMLISNPPYVGEAEYATLPHEVRLFEPKTALVPQLPCGAGAQRHGASGLEHCLAVMEEAQRLLKAGGLLLMEIGFLQGGELLRRLDKRVWHAPGVQKDLAGLDRVLHAIKAQ